MRVLLDSPRLHAAVLGLVPAAPLPEAVLSEEVGLLPPSYDRRRRSERRHCDAVPNAVRPRGQPLTTRTIGPLIRDLGVPPFPAAWRGAGRRPSHRLSLHHHPGMSAAERARAIERYLRRHRRNVTGAPSAASLPVLRAFLAPSGTGTPVQFASTFALLMRVTGVPSRLTVGFSPGTRRDGIATVHGRDVHVMVELRYDDVGWVTHNPTPGGHGCRRDGSGTTTSRFRTSTYHRTHARPAAAAPHSLHPRPVAPAGPRAPARRDLPAPRRHCAAPASHVAATPARHRERPGNPGLARRARGVPDDCGRPRAPAHARSATSRHRRSDRCSLPRGPTLGRDGRTGALRIGRRRRPRR